jgi:hypothetical protein
MRWRGTVFAEDGARRSATGCGLARLCIKVENIDKPRSGGSRLVPHSVE